MPTCIEWAEERTQECTETADQGFNECSGFRAQCCTWWPCSWGCEAVSWVCIGYKWVENIVCVGWTWVSTAVCVAWDVVTMMASAMMVAVEFIVGGVLSVLAAAVEWGAFSVRNGNCRCLGIRNGTGCFAGAGMVYLIGTGVRNAVLPASVMR